MKDILASRIGKEVDVSFGAGAVSGKITKIEDNILHLEKDEKHFFVRIDKIVAVWDSLEKSEKRIKGPGFVSS